MDPITHALSGIVSVQCLPKDVRPRWMPLWGALVAASPDIDVIFCRTPVQYIEWHRGFSHSLLGTALFAVFWAGLLLWLLHREGPVAGKPGMSAARHGWTFPLAWGFAWFLLLLHVWLDCVTSYGTQVLLPFTDFRVRFSGLFIVDPVLILTMTLGLLFGARSRKAMVAVLMVVLLYPALACGARIELEKSMAARLPKELHGQPVTAVHYTTDAFAPLFWKLIVETPHTYYVAGPLTPCSPVPENFTAYPRPDATRWAQLAAEDASFRAYTRFAQFPYLETERTLSELPPELAQQLPNALGPFTERVYTDLRFGSGLSFVQRIQGTEDKETEKTFRITALFDNDQRLVAVRFRVVRGAGGDSGWMPVQ